MTETEPTLEQVKKDLLEFAGFTSPISLQYPLYPISLDWLAERCWPKLGDPTVSIERLPTGYAMEGQFEAELNWADASSYSQVGWGPTRAEAAARATYAAIMEVKK